MPKHFALLLSLLIFTACNRGATTAKFPEPVDTRTKEIALQEVKTWRFPEAGLRIDNMFDGARVNGVFPLEDSSYQIDILPENEPINPSPWYAMRLESYGDREVTLRLTYPYEVKHRYYPKTSTDRKKWTPVPGEDVEVSEDRREAIVRLKLKGGRPVFLAAQEVINSGDVRAWIDGVAAKHGNVVRPFTAGQSKLGRYLPAFTIAANQLTERPTIVLLSRQHPPEVTGYLCLQAFIDGILDHPRREEFLANYQVLVYPLLNPDGVDLGHWRHTAGGIDSNRDWAKYRQPEAHQIADDITARTRAVRSRVVLGMDFHSTYKDVYYTHLPTNQPPTALPGFKDAWLAGIEEGIGGDFKINEQPRPISKPTTMAWFRTQFGAEGVTYEIGDATDRDFVERKGRVSAKAMIDVLLER